MIAESDTALETVEQEMTDVRAELAPLQAALRDLDDQFDALVERARNDESYFAQWDTVDDFDALTKLSQALAAEGDIAVVNYQQKRKSAAFGASRESAAAHAALKQRGADALSALKMPDLPTLPESAPWLKPVGADDRGVADLVEKGYLRKSTAALDYHCAKRDAATAARGIHLDKCGRYNNIYTALGPFYFPEGLCGGYMISVLLPPGVPAPRGEPCHSQVTDLGADY